MASTIGTLSLIAVLLGPAVFEGDVEESRVPLKSDGVVLANEGMPFAEKMLREQGEFATFSMAMSTDGEILHVGADDDREHPTSQDAMFSQLREGAQDGRYRAIAIFSDIRMLHPKINKKVKVVQVGFEDLTGLCYNTSYPYTLPLEKIDRDEILLTERTGTVFSNCR